jgi:hypothetical protein
MDRGRIERVPASANRRRMQRAKRRNEPIRELEDDWRER